MNSDSMLESNENNCGTTSFTTGDTPVDTEEPTEDVSIRARQSIISEGGTSSACIGIRTDGVCRPLPESCAVVVEDEEDIATEGCISSWEVLVTAVKEKLDDQRDFIICPGSTLAVDSQPVVIDSDYITIQCGLRNWFQST